MRPTSGVKIGISKVKEHVDLKLYLTFIIFVGMHYDDEPKFIGFALPSSAGFTNYALALAINITLFLIGKA